jgi:hypothetical protein
VQARVESNTKASGNVAVTGRLRTTLGARSELAHLAAAGADTGRLVSSTAGGSDSGGTGNTTLTIVPASPQGSPWPFILRPDFVTDIGVGANGSVFVVGTNPVVGGYGIYRWNGLGSPFSRGAQDCGRSCRQPVGDQLGPSDLPPDQPRPGQRESAEMYLYPQVC